MASSAFTKDDILLGLGGGDLIPGGPGNDSLEGGAGIDRMEGNSGNDVYRFDADTPLSLNTVIESIGEGNDMIDFGAAADVGIVFNLSLSTFQEAAPGSFVRLAGDLEVEQLISSARDDTLTGNSLNNVIIGAAGNDTLRGVGGRDLLVGGTGLDQLFGGDGEDILIGDSLDYYSEALQQPDRLSVDLLMLEWTRTNLSYDTRILNLKFGGGLNGAARISVITVRTDAVRDEMQGDADRDWFWSSGTDSSLDLSIDVLETVN